MKSLLHVSAALRSHLQGVSVSNNIYSVLYSFFSCKW